jgi:hypothetical protein
VPTPLLLHAWRVSEAAVLLSALTTMLKFRIRSGGKSSTLKPPRTKPRGSALVLPLPLPPSLAALLTSLWPLYAAACCQPPPTPLLGPLLMRHACSSAGAAVRQAPLGKAETDSTSAAAQGTSGTKGPPS